MASFKLDDIVAAAEAKYGSMDIELSDGKVVSLVNPLRLPKLKRDELGNMGDRLEEDGVDQAEVFEDALRIAGHTQKALVEKLIKEIGGDLAVLAQVFEDYTKGTQVGEASASQN